MIPKSAAHKHSQKPGSALCSVHPYNAEALSIYHFEPKHSFLIPVY